MKNVGYTGMPHRLKRIPPKYAFCNRYAVDQMDAVLSNAIHFGKSRNKGKPIGTGRVQHSCQLSADVAPQSRVGFFIYAADAGRKCMFHSFSNYGICLLWFQMPRFRIHDQYLYTAVHLGKIEGGIRNDAGNCPVGGKLYASIQSSGKIISNDQQFDHALPPYRLYLKHFVLFSKAKNPSYPQTGFR